MVGASDSGEIFFGLTIDGMYKIILRPGKWFCFFFKKKHFLGKFFFLCQFLICLMYKEFFSNFFFCNFFESHL